MNPEEDDKVSPMKARKVKTKNIYLLTLVGREYNNNYGAVLQAYALQEIIKSMDFSPLLLDISPNFNTQEKVKKNWIRLAKFVIMNLKDYYCLLSASGMLFNLKRYPILEKIRTQKFYQWKEMNLIFKEGCYRNVQNLLREFSNSNDVFLVGSDQVWNPYISKELLETFLLRFTESKNKMSYASSVGVPIPTEMYNVYKTSLEQFKHVSVREKSSAKWLEEVTGINVRVVLDPALLLKKERWLKLSKKVKTNLDEPYILVYDLLRSYSILPIVNKITINKPELSFINYNPRFINNRYRKLKYNYYTCDPSEFLWLLSNSDVVVTSSFHGTLFSIIFHKPFWTVLPNVSNKRILNILSMLNLESRVLESPKQLLKKDIYETIDWNNVAKKIDKMRKTSLAFLKESLYNLSEGGDNI